MAVQPNQNFSLDGTQEKDFIVFYKKLPVKPSTTIRFFDRSDYYTVHGSDATFTALEVFKTINNVKAVGTGENRLEYMVLSKTNFITFVRELLLVKQYRVEVYVGKGSGSRTHDWALESMGSPGNLTQFEDLLFSSGEVTVSAGVLAVKAMHSGQNLKLGVAYFESLQKNIQLMEFADDENSLDILQSIIVQLSPKECVFPSGNQVPYPKIKEIMSKNNIMVTERKVNDFSTNNAIQDLNRLLHFASGQQKNCAGHPELQKTVALSAVCVLVKYLELLSDNTNFNKFRLCPIQSSEFLKLDRAAMKALHIEPSPQAASKQHDTQSLFGLLNHCRTGHGKRLLEKWVRQPLKDLRKLQERMDVVETFVSDPEILQTLSEEHLRRIPDMQNLGYRFMKTKATLIDCYKVYQAVLRFPKLIECLENVDEIHKPIITALFVVPLKQAVVDFQKFIELVETTIDMERAKDNDLVIKADFDENLEALRAKMDKLEADMKKELNRVARDLSMEPTKAVKLETHSQIGYHFRVTLKDEKALRNNSSYKLIDTNKNGVRFHTSALRKLNEEYLAAKEEYNEQQKHITQEVIEISGGYCDPLQVISEVLAQLDVLVSFATAANAAPLPYVRPTLTESGIMTMKQVRHPCLELQEGVSFIPNDVVFNKNDKYFYMITGPNMGGKSTYIRSVGVVAFMAHIGSFVPCENATIPILDAIYARVGAGDCQQRGISTFMAEMIEAAAIVKSATPNSLVIIDELGRGTSTHDGLGLAWAISQYLATECKSYSVFATHYQELTTMPLEVPAVGNLHVTAQMINNVLTFLYEVKEGSCNQSFGIHVAEMVRFPEHVIKDARIKLLELESLPATEEDKNNEPPNKKAKSSDNSSEMILNFLNQTKQLNIDKMSNEELLEEIAKNINIM